MLKHGIILLLWAMLVGCQPLPPPVLPGVPPGAVPAGPGPAIAGAPSIAAVPQQSVVSPWPSTAWPQPQTTPPQGVPWAAAPPPASPPITVPPAPPPQALGTSLPGPLGGTSISPEFGLPAAPEPVGGLPNPLQVPVANEGLAWEQIADVVSDYFQIASERRARRVGSVWTEGLIESAPLGGATILEPQRRDSVGEFNRWESTFQTIRRRATVRVTPNSSGYLVMVEVQKELENLPRPELATAGAATLRFDQSLPDRETWNVPPTPESILWISMGRDAALEQLMLADIQARLAGSVPPGVGP